MTRQQPFMKAAYDHVTKVLHDADRDPPAIDKDVYGSLCHRFPVMIRTNGLCQTLAFLAAKGGGNGAREEAYRRIADHAAAVVGAAGRADLLTRTQGSRPADYRHDTRTILAAWVYYKRFAVSILDITAEKDPEPEPGAES